MLVRYCYIAIWTLIVIVLSLLPKSAINEDRIRLFEGADKIIHFLMYFILMSIWYYAGKKISKKKRRRFIIIGVVFGIFLGIILEILQNYLDIGRSFDTFDIVADITGLFFVFLINKNFKDEF